MDTTENTTTEKVTIQMDKDIGDSLIVEDQPRPPSVIFLDSPNGDLEGPSNKPNPLPHTTFEIENEEKQAKPTTTQAVTSKAPTAITALYTRTCDSPSGTSSVYATPPCHPTRERTQIVVSLM